mmetsp:Transcript_128042/g.292572  ORF Transcript_128042/g.292572 Transcript_128042/m.292572 type:complete len:241 (+) Transcript_128042:119-841(+)
MKFAVLWMSSATAASIQLRGRSPEADEFDCYVGKGADYTGLHKQTKSGRPCIKWPGAPDDFTYCRNRDEEMNQPYCFFADGEKEACAVPKCAAGAEALHGWEADSNTVTHTEPCTPKPKPSSPFEEWDSGDGKMCSKTRTIADRSNVTQTNVKGVGMKLNYDISGKKGPVWMAKLVTADDKDACSDECKTAPGAKFMTFWSSGAPESYGEEGANCGCFYECIFMDDDLTTGGPTTYRRKY